MLGCFGHVQIIVTLWSVACQAPLSVGILQKPRAGCHALLQGVFPTQGSNAASVLQADSLLLITGKDLMIAEWE